MAMAPPRPCSYGKCPHLQPCPDHPVTPWRSSTGVPVKRIRGRELQRRRAWLFAQRPWCSLCIVRGIHAKATIRDHIIPLAEGGPDDETNEQGLCAPCSKTKTEAESQRGVRRGFMR